MRGRAVLRGLGLFGLEVAALVVLHRVDLPSVEWSGFGAWIDATPPEDAIVALVRSASLVVTYYLLVTTALIIIANIARIPALVRGVRLVSLPGLRRVVEGVAAVSIVAAPPTSATAALAHDPSPVVATMDAESYVPTPAGDAVDVYRPTPAADEAAPSDGRLHVVVSGESLWSIAEAAVPTSTPQRAQAVARYWRSIIELNIDTLESGDPDLIFPGEQLQLPGPDGS